MEWLVPIIVGLFSMVGSVVSAFILHNKNSVTLDLRLNHQTAILDKRIDHLSETLELKLTNLSTMVDDLKSDIECVEGKVDQNISETSKIKVKVVSLEKDVEALKKNNGASYVRG